MEKGSESSDLPIALRRTRRSLGQERTSSSGTSDTNSNSGNPVPKQIPIPCASPKRPARETIVVRTPNSRKRHVRFSDPGPDLARKKNQSSTGLTPMIQRTSLSSSRTPRRRSTPARLFPSNGNGIPALDSQGSPFGGEVHFLPLRQVLDGRVKRRIRRNGLSEEMNTILAERRRRAEETKAELQRLRTELAEKDEEIERLHDETAVLDTERVWDLEQQVASLRKELASRSGAQEPPSSPPVGWARASHEPYSDDSMEFDIQDAGAEFGEITRAELACSTPTRQMRASFPTPPATSPESQISETPCRRLPTPCSSTGTQISLPDPEKQQREEELSLLQLEVAKLTTTLESYSTLTSRLSEKLTPVLTRTSTDEPPAEVPDIETHLTTVLQTLSDRTAALAKLDSSLKTLGFPGSDGFEVIESLRSSLRSARLELEYLTPGESTLPLTGAGAEVLALILTKLRTLADQNHANTDTIDEYHALTVSLRSQLRSRVAATDSLSAELATAERAVHAKDAHIAALDARLADRARDLAAAQAQTEELRAELVALGAAHAEELAALGAAHAEERAALEEAHGAELAARDARVAELGREVERVGGALDEAREVVRGLRAENKRLGEVGRVLSEDVASVSGRAGKRRKYDSGLGLLDEEADEVDM
ncbi:hypothetical protein B0I37DRAFT_397704 [Chaetomium sp. MPI-CAGE-AT-0009]|nr:hypothetical protein B0I37DRAFT_397704 [Chaetomium sp. MPI-CAGE-AT-0009]